MAQRGQKNLASHAEPGYAIVACVYADNGVIGDPDDIGPVQRVDVDGWSFRKGKRYAVVYQGFDFPRTGWHVMGYVYPDGTVSTKEGYRLKNLEWWIELVRAFRRVIAAGQIGEPAKDGVMLYDLGGQLPAEAFA